MAGHFPFKEEYRGVRFPHGLPVSGCRQWRYIMSVIEANQVAELIKNQGVMVTERDITTIAKEGFDDGIYNGDWTTYINLPDAGVTILLIQEDEYEQSMDYEAPEGCEEIGYTGGVYVFFLD